MLGALAVAIFFMAVTLTFSREIKALIKKVGKIPGMTLLLPLILVTWFIVFAEPRLRIALNNLRLLFLQCILAPLSFLEFPYSFFVVAIIYLTLIGMLPLLFIKFYNQRRFDRPVEYGVLLSLMLWIFAVLLLMRSFIPDV